MSGLTTVPQTTPNPCHLDRSRRALCGGAVERSQHWQFFHPPQTQMFDRLCICEGATLKIGATMPVAKLKLSPKLRKMFESRRGKKPSDIPLNQFLSELALKTKGEKQTPADR
jgi:hypothetical protein